MVLQVTLGDETLTDVGLALGRSPLLRGALAPQPLLQGNKAGCATTALLQDHKLMFPPIEWRD